MDKVLEVWTLESGCVSGTPGIEAERGTRRILIEGGDVDPQGSSKAEIGVTPLCHHNL